MEGERGVRVGGPRGQVDRGLAGERRQAGEGVAEPDLVAGEQRPKPGAEQQEEYRGGLHAVAAKGVSHRMGCAYRGGHGHALGALPPRGLASGRSRSGHSLLPPGRVRGRTGVTADLARQLQFGVALFFLISGFLLYRPFVAARLRGEPMPFVGAYAWRRFLRIVPAYWVALTATALLLKPEVFDHAVRFYAFGQVYSFEHALGGLAVAWSLCVEVSFYVTLPLWAMAARRLPGETSAAGCARSWWRSPCWPWWGWPSASGPRAEGAASWAPPT